MCVIAAVVSLFKVKTNKIDDIEQHVMCVRVCVCVCVCMPVPYLFPLSGHVISHQSASVPVSAID